MTPLNDTASASPAVGYGLHATITRETAAVLDELPELLEEGVTSVKLLVTDDIWLSNGCIGEVFD